MKGRWLPLLLLCLILAGCGTVDAGDRLIAGAEGAEAGCIDYFINARELYRIFLRTGGRPAVKRPAKQRKKQKKNRARRSGEGCPLQRGGSAR